MGGLGGWELPQRERTMKSRLRVQVGESPRLSTCWTRSIVPHHPWILWTWIHYSEPILISQFLESLQKSFSGVFILTIKQCGCLSAPCPDRRLQKGKATSSGCLFLPGVWVFGMIPFQWVDIWKSKWNRVVIEEQRFSCTCQLSRATRRQKQAIVLACFSLGKSHYQEWEQPQSKIFNAYSVKETFWP